MHYLIKPSQQFGHQDYTHLAPVVVVLLSFSSWTGAAQLMCAAAAAKSLQSVRLCATPQTAAHQAPPSLGFSRQGHWSGLPFPSPMHESEKGK